MMLKFCAESQIGLELIGAAKRCLKMEHEIDDLTTAVDEDDLRKVQSLLKKHPETLDQLDRGGNSALYWSIHLERFKIFKYLLSKNADVNIAGNWNMTPLHTAAEEGRPEYAELLIKNGAELDAKSKQPIGKRTPLYLAAIRLDQSPRYAEPFRQVVELLIANGATVDANSAVLIGDNDKLKELIVKNPNLGIVALDKQELLENAAAVRNVDAARILLEHGLTPTPEALGTAIRASEYEWDPSSQEILELYLKAGAGQFLHSTEGSDLRTHYERAKALTSVPAEFLELIEQYNPEKS